MRVGVTGDGSLSRFSSDVRYIIEDALHAKNNFQKRGSGQMILYAACFVPCGYDSDLFTQNGS